MMSFEQILFNVTRVMTVVPVSTSKNRLDDLPLFAGQHIDLQVTFALREDSLGKRSHVHLAALAGVASAKEAWKASFANVAVVPYLIDPDRDANDWALLQYAANETPSDLHTSEGLDASLLSQSVFEVLPSMLSPIHVTGSLVENPECTMCFTIPLTIPSISASSNTNESTRVVGIALSVATAMPCTTPTEVENSPTFIFQQSAGRPVLGTLFVPLHIHIPLFLETEHRRVAGRNEILVSLICRIPTGPFAVTIQNTRIECESTRRKLSAPTKQPTWSNSQIYSGPDIFAGACCYYLRGKCRYGAKDCMNGPHDSNSLDASCHFGRQCSLHHKGSHRIPHVHSKEVVQGTRCPVTLRPGEEFFWAFILTIDERFEKEQTEQNEEEIFLSTGSFDFVDRESPAIQKANKSLPEPTTEVDAVVIFSIEGIPHVQLVSSTTISWPSSQH